MIFVHEENKFLHILFFCCVCALFVGISFWGGKNYTKASLIDSVGADTSSMVTGGDSISEISLAPEKDFASIIASGINAKAALSLYPTGPQSGKVLFEQNQDQKLPVASLTKLMTALVALERYDAAQKTQISALAMAQEGAQGTLKEGETLSVRNLLFIALIESSNRAAFALSEIMGTEAFIAAMNEKAQALGMVNTHFDDTTGLSNGSYSTARDIAMLAQYLFETQPLFKEIIGYRSYGLYVDGSFHHLLENTNKLLGWYHIIGGKTGWTTEARGCFMAIQQYETGEYRVNVILGAEDRFSEMEKLIITANQ